ncbi:hypothetical protein GTR04_1774 [Trichophyton interdigitale]|uniref:Retrovirus-related Pol polyprotein from transposon TNT 1-94-like beta-barrel domain-containing protein n=1 Tax=Trichophyton interdigitale TaxID=101480 RepID=A0A9P5CZE9_9EURO|nr:hypothetical protein GY631_1538 [Trichophyton interdigitale]KAF3899320.1 hypothetical protein GY632_1336 [Trichophyton interdigitale]KAG8210816.1 hypothetical protein GTR04_1774 [Trichophyton interdigitale]
MGEIGEYWEENRAYKKRKLERRKNNPPKQRCFDWMITSGISYAKNRSSFKTYRHIRPVTLSSGTGARVIGVGSVELKVPRSPDNPEVNTLILDDVLHIPGAICNGFSPQLLGGSTSFGDPLQGYDDDKQPSYYATTFCGLWRLVLNGNPEGETQLAEARRNGSKLFLSVYINEEDEEHIFGN